MKVSIKLHRNSVVVYYYNHGEKKYISTGCKVDKPGDFSGWEFRKNVPGCVSMNKIIRDKLNQVQEILDDYYHEYKKFPSVSWLTEKIEGEKVSDNRGDGRVKLLDSWGEWFNKYKANHKESTNKTYGQLSGIIRRFQAQKQKFIYLDELNEEFMQEFEVFLRNSYSNSTGRKRFFQFKLYLKHTYIKNNIPAEALKVKSSLTNDFQNEIVFFHVEELKEIAELELDEKDGRIRDIMLFLCYTGLRISDVRKIKKEMIEFNRQTPILQMYTKKTKTKVIIPLNKKALEILHKRNFNLDINGQLFNRSIKKILVEHSICTGKIAVDSTRQNDTVVNYIEKYKLISSKVGRKTFISLLLLNNTPILSIMAATGHSEIATIQAYAAKLLPPGKENMTDFMV